MSAEYKLHATSVTDDQTVAEAFKAAGYSDQYVIEIILTLIVKTVRNDANRTKADDASAPNVVDKTVNAARRTVQARLSPLASSRVASSAASSGAQNSSYTTSSTRRGRSSARL